MINGVAIILMLIVTFITAWCAYAVGYDSGKRDGYVEGDDNGYSEGWAAHGGCHENLNLH